MKKRTFLVSPLVCASRRLAEAVPSHDAAPARSHSRRFHSRDIVEVSLEAMIERCVDLSPSFYPSRRSKETEQTVPPRDWNPSGVAREEERDQVAQERDRVAQELEAERQRTERVIAQLRAMGLEPP